ncbi:MAG: hypothetical protein AAF648_12040 [Pseudomonadota bacterium]
MSTRYSLLIRLKERDVGRLTADHRYRQQIVENLDVQRQNLAALTDEYRQSAGEYSGLPQLLKQRHALLRSLLEADTALSLQRSSATEDLARVHRALVGAQARLAALRRLESIEVQERARRRRRRERKAVLNQWTLSRQEGPKI